MFAMVDMGIEDYNADGDGIKVKTLQKKVVKCYILLCQNSGTGVSGAVG